MDRYSEDIPVLVGQTGPLNGQRWMLRGSITIGRDESCEIVIPSRQVSRQHVRLTSKKGSILLEDLGSKNGTHHNGQRIEQPVLLSDGDVIQVAVAQQFVFLSSDATLPLDMIEGFVEEPAVAGKLRLEKRSRRVWIGEEEILPPLSASQFHLLQLLSDQEGKVVSRKELIAEVWGEEQALEVSEQALDALIRRLRDRLAAIDPANRYIVTVRGHGLRLENPPA